MSTKGDLPCSACRLADLPPGLVVRKFLRGTWCEVRSARCEGLVTMVSNGSRARCARRGQQARACRAGLAWPAHERTRAPSKGPRGEGRAAVGVARWLYLAGRAFPPDIAIGSLDQKSASIPTFALYRGTDYPGALAKNVRDLPPRSIHRVRSVCSVRLLVRAPARAQRVGSDLAPHGRITRPQKLSPRADCVLLLQE